jgi:hypothetical protein
VVLDNVADHVVNRPLSESHLCQLAFGAGWELLAAELGVPNVQVQ